MKILGHRGIRQEDKNKPYQNTLEAIKYAFDNDADGIEIDVWMSKDNRVIVIHDNEINIHSETSKGKITEKTLKEINNVKLDKVHSISNIPALQEILEILPENKILNIEIKQENISKYLLEEIKNYRTENIIISSFNHDELEKVREKNKDIKIGILFDSKTADRNDYYEYLIKLDEKINSYCYIPNCYTKNPKILNSEKPKFFWTIKEKEIFDRTVERLSKLPNANFITDYPEILIPYIKQEVI